MAFMYCSISVLASVVALNNVVASSGCSAQTDRVMHKQGPELKELKPSKTLMDL